MKIPIVGGALLKFGQLWEIGINELIYEAGDKVLSNSGIKSEDVDSLFISNALTGNEKLCSIAFEELGINNSICISSGDVSGALAIKQAATSILSGQSKIAMVLGVEKCTDFKNDELINLTSQSLDEDEYFIGATIQSQFALIMKKYLNDFGLDRKEFSFIPVNNHKNALSNDYAQYGVELTEDKINSSPIVADPIRMLDCASYCDGAAALIMCSEELEKNFSNKGYLLASSSATDFLSIAKRKSITTMESTVKAAKEAYKEAKITQEQINKLEVYDINPIAEVLAVEDLDFAKKGEGINFIKRNLQKINNSGGLKACGHAVGATGVRQAVDILNQLKDNGYGITQTISGTGGISVVNIFGK